jgi:hypothetical protein
MKLADLQDTNLNGWKIIQIYTMEKSHCLMGYFPLIVDNTHIVIACTKRNDLKRIWESLPKCNVKINKDLVLVNLAMKLVVPIKNQNVSSDDFLLIDDDIEAAMNCIKFDYAPGLISFIDESNCEFPEE